MDTIKTTQVVTIDYESCIECGIFFAMPKAFVQRLRYSGQTFYCPNGHAMIYRDERSKLLGRIKELENDRQWFKDEAETTKRKLSAARGTITKIKTRIINGICPCCHRQFVNLQRHMNIKHPNYLGLSENE